MANQRQQMTPHDLDYAVNVVHDKLLYRANQKGLGTYASIHEALGILMEEMTEFTDEVHAKNSKQNQIEELKDIAVGAIWAIASIQTGGVDW